MDKKSEPEQGKTKWLKEGSIAILFGVAIVGVSALMVYSCGLAVRIFNAGAGW